MKVFRVTIPVVMMVPEDHNRAICGIDAEIDEHWAFEAAIHLSETLEDADTYFGLVKVEIDGITAVELRPSTSNERCQDSPKSTLESDARPDLYADLRVGDYVHFKQDWDLQPIATVRSGMTGTVTVKNEDGIWIKIDQDLNISEDYDNSIQFNRDTFRSCDGESLESYVLPLNF